jgi:threonylcarbamoyladenosine tRNA methylthiotransferase MtaB
MKVFLDTVGCRLNQAEIEAIARQFRAAGHEIVATAAEADLAVINTCTVTSEAASDSRGKIRQVARAGLDRIIATGCWATLEPGQAAQLPGVVRVVPNQQKDTLVPDFLNLPPAFFDLEPIARTPLPGLRARTRAFIKVQDGCDNACTFCITTVARGASRSRPLEEILKDVQSALDGGVQEIVLTGVHLGSWGRDFTSPQRLADLVSALLTRTSIPRLRLSSLEPWDLDSAFFDLWQDPRLCRHLHLPLQSGSRSVLRRMARRTTPEAFAALVDSARQRIPDVAVTTDVIVGFPGETEAEFEETVSFVRDLSFAGGHVFAYSARPGTPAARMKNQLHGEIVRERSARLRQLFAELAAMYRRRFVGQKLSVLWETVSQLSDSGWKMEGLTDNYLRVFAYAPEPRWNRLDTVLLTAMEEDELGGVIEETNHDARPSEDGRRV